MKTPTFFRRKQIKHVWFFEVSPPPTKNLAATLFGQSNSLQVGTSHGLVLQRPQSAAWCSWFQSSSANKPAPLWHRKNATYPKDPKWTQTPPKKTPSFEQHQTINCIYLKCIFKRYQVTCMSPLNVLTRRIGWSFNKMMANRPISFQRFKLFDWEPNICNCNSLDKRKGSSKVDSNRQTFADQKNLRELDPHNYGNDNIFNIR